MKNIINPTASRLCVLVLAATMLALRPACAQDADEHYLGIFSLIERADALSAAGQTGPALARYRQAQTGLQIMQRDYPNFNSKAVAYRLHYVSDRITALAPPHAAGAGDTASGARSEAPGSAMAKLVEAGAEPRTVLRLHPTAGDKQTLNMTMNVGMDITVGETAVPNMKMPAIKLAMDVAVTNVSPEGDITYTMTLGDASVAEDAEASPTTALAVQAIKGALDKMKGLTGTGTRTSRGISKEAEFNAPSDTDPQVRQIAEQLKESISTLVLPLPEEAVGAGAKWEAKMPLKSQGLTISQTGSYELASIEGDRLNIKCLLTQTAGAQKYQNPQMPQVKMDLTKMTGNGKGEVTYDLTHLLPQEGTMEFHSEYAMSMNAGGQKQAMNMKMDANLRFDAK